MCQQAGCESFRARDMGVALVAFVLLATVSVTEVKAQWAQFGGPNRDFTVESGTLSIEWPKKGPKRLWKKKLGDGLAGIAADDGALYTMFRKKGKEFIVALDPNRKGKRIWTHKYKAPLHDGIVEQFGIGPRATPLILGEHVYTIGVAGMMHCLNKKTGDVVWQHDLIKEYGSRPQMFGFGSSPIAYNDMIIVPVGGEGHGVVAFNAADGSVAWARHDYKTSYSSPILIELDGEKQLVALMSGLVAGLNPDDGAELWTFQHKTDPDVNAAMPVWGADRRLFISSAYGTGSRMLEVKRKSAKTKAREVWKNRKVQVHFGSVIRDGDVLYLSNGGNGPCFLSAVDAATGEVLWKERGFAKAQLLRADGKLIILDEDGVLAIATVSREKLEVHAQAELFKTLTRTAPTLVGQTLYVRDASTLYALDLG